MKKLYVLCILTLAAVILDITLLHTGSVSAQTSNTNLGAVVHVERVQFSGASGTVARSGNVVGFHCVDVQGQAQCFVAMVW